MDAKPDMHLQICIWLGKQDNYLDREYSLFLQLVGNFFFSLTPWQKTIFQQEKKYKTVKKNTTVVNILLGHENSLKIEILDVFSLYKNYPVKCFSFDDPAKTTNITYNTI